VSDATWLLKVCLDLQVERRQKEGRARGRTAVPTLTTSHSSSKVTTLLLDTAFFSFQNDRNFLFYFYAPLGLGGLDQVQVASFLDPCFERQRPPDSLNPPNFSCRLFEQAKVL
jgi:hypothetical protein